MQLTIFDVPPKQPPVYPPRFARWLEFHRANPAVWRLFRDFAITLRQRNDKGSARMIGERIRWEVAVLVDQADGETYKLNDHLWPYYARLMRETVDGFGDFFDTRGELDVPDHVIVQEGGLIRKPKGDAHD